MCGKFFMASNLGRVELVPSIKQYGAKIILLKIHIVLFLFFIMLETSYSQTLIELDTGSVDPDVFITTNAVQGSELASSMVKGDFNGDSIDDLAVSAPGEPNPLTGTASGMVMIFYGGQNISNLPANFPTGNQTNHYADVRLFSLTDGGMTGSKLAAGKLNGDNIDDLVIVEQNTSNVSDTLIYVIFGSGALNPNYRLDQDSDLILERTDDNMWISAITVADVTGDNQEDLIIADILTMTWPPVPQTQTLMHHTHPTNPQKDINGGVYIVKGPISASTAHKNLVTDADIYVLKNDGTDRFQITSLAVGDVDGDAQSELLMAHQYESNLTPATNAGAVFIRNAGAGLPIGVVDIAPGGILSCKVIYGGWQDDQLGGPYHTMASATPLTGRGSLAIGDVNNDQINDIVIGSPMSKYNGTQTTGTGKVEVVFGKTPFPSVTELHSLYDDADIRINLTSAYSDTKLGYAVSTEDVNGDGIADITMGAPQARIAGGTTYNGAVYTIYGSASIKTAYNLATEYDIGFAAPKTPDNYAAGRMGTSFLVGEFNNSGTKDYFLGAPKGASSTHGWVGIFWNVPTAGDGDVNDDGDTNLTDIILVLQVLTGMAPNAIRDDIEAADVNFNTKLDFAEVIFAMRHLAGLK